MRCLAVQRPDGHCVFELEADATIPAEYILLQHYLDEIVPEEQRRWRKYLRAVQGEHGGWPLFHGGAFDMSASVKAYFALKAAGDSIDARICCARGRRSWNDGGAARTNVFTRDHAGAVRRDRLGRGAGDAGRDHAAAAVVSVSSQQDFLLVPHRDRAAAGADGEKAARQGIRAASMLPNCSCRVAKRIRRVQPARCGRSCSTAWTMCCACFENRMPRRSRERAIAAAVAFVTERLNGEDGLGGDFSRRWPTP